MIYKKLKGSDIYPIPSSPTSDGSRDGSRTAATSKMEHFVIIVRGLQWLTIITKCSILEVPAVLDPLLGSVRVKSMSFHETQRSSCSHMFYQIAVLKNLAKFTGKHLFRSLFSNKVADL